MSTCRILRICLGRSIPLTHKLKSERFNSLNYSQQIRELQQGNLIYPGSWSAAMNKLGNESVDVLVDIKPIQEKWCIENKVNIDFRSANWMIKVLSAQIVQMEPTILFFQGGAFQAFSTKQREYLRSNHKSIRLIIGFWGDALTNEAHYRQAFGGTDFMFTASHRYTAMFERARIKCETLGWSFEPDVDGARDLRIKKLAKNDLVFTGSTGYGQDLHRGRYDDLVEIMGKTNLHVWADEADLKKQKTDQIEDTRRASRKLFSKAIHTLLEHLSIEMLQKLRRSSLINWKFAKIIESQIDKKRGVVPKGEYFVSKKKISQLFPERSHPAVYGKDYYQLIGESRVVLNRHRDEIADGPNIRVYEVTGAGACLLTDREELVSEYFDIDSEVVTYSSPQEAVEKALYLLRHDEERSRIARAGQEKTLRLYTTAQRCKRVDQVLKSLL